MNSRNVRVAVCALVALAAMIYPHRLHARSDSPQPTATLRTGSLAGTRLDTSNGQVAFLGIPFAAPPVADLRWKPPQPPAAWSDIRQAVQFGPACPQLPAAWLPYPAWSEDCLYLNVWTPQLSPKAKLPVLVYFHGGSNRVGYSQLTPLGPTLSAMGVVVVTANYRLGPFGFLAHPALTAEAPHHSSGDYGLLDQIQALKWVQENIVNFGGDPGRITVMGQSSGSVDICLLLASPLASHLFQRAIMESGDCQGTLNKDIRTPIPYNEISGTGEGDGERLAADLGISNGPDTLRKLRSLPANAILKAWSADPQIEFDAIVDGWVVPEQPATIFAEGKQAHVPVLVGSNADEATVFGHGLSTVAEYKKYLLDDTGKYAEQELHAWPVSDDAKVEKEYIELQDDTFAYGAWSMARAMTRVGESAYLYRFGWTESGKRAQLGAYHGEELSFLSNSFPAHWGPSEDDSRFGDTVRRYWINFAKEGNPNQPDLPDWSAYKFNSDRLLELGHRISMQTVNDKVWVLEKLMTPVLDR